MNIIKQMIPRIEKLIADEKDHLKMLINKNKGGICDRFIETSKWYLNHYKLRLKQYQEYTT